MTVGTSEPTEITEGDSAAWTVDLPDYKPADSWVLTYTFASATVAAFALVCTNNGDGRHLATLTAALGANLKAGNVGWTAVLTKGTERITIRRGDITVDAKLTVGQTLDNRSYARRVLDAIEATLENRATSDQLQLSYSSANGGSRSIQHSSIAQLMEARTMLQSQLATEEMREDYGAGRNFLPRFVRI